MEILIEKEVEGLRINEVVRPSYEKILTSEALGFITSLHRQFTPKRLELLKKRKKRQKLLSQGQMPRFPENTHGIREGHWKAAPIPLSLQDRQVEITGPVDRKVIVMQGANQLESARTLSNSLVLANHFEDFLTTRAYEYLR